MDEVDKICHLNLYTQIPITYLLVHSLSLSLSHTHIHTHAHINPTVYSTSGDNLLNRTYNLNQYFYCERCKTFYLRENDGEENTEIEPCDNNTSQCSSIDMTKAVIYPGNVEEQGIKSELGIW